MKARVRLLLIALLASQVAMGSVHTVPKDRASLTPQDWFPYIISKIAPLEWWSFVAFPADLRREDFASDFLFDIAQQERTFPRFCYALFRPRREDVASLLSATQEYQGAVSWVMVDNCIGAMPAGSRTTFISAMPSPEDLKNLEQQSQNPPAADPELVKLAMADIPRFCDYLEKRLGLIDKPPQDFGPQMLTREGLLASRGQFEDYFESGDWSVFLARRPREYARTSRPTSDADRDLGIGVRSDANYDLLTELGARWEKSIEEVKPPLLPEFPLISRLEDETEDTVYEPREVDALLKEYLRAQAIVKNPNAIRALDDLIRIARWAQKLKLGIYFSGQ